MKRSFVAALAACSLLATSVSAQTTWYVDDDSTCSSGCGTQGAPFQQIQEAIFWPAVQPGDLILVAPGSYTPINTLGKELEIRSTSGAGVTEIRETNPSGNSVVTYEFGEGPSAILDGFSITGGSGTILSATYLAGGGILCYDSSPTIRNCRIYGNGMVGTFLVRGAGVAALQNAMPELRDCVIENNAGTGFDGGSHGGGGVSGPARLFGCTLRNNSITSDGFLSGGGGGAQGAYLEDCLLEGNVVTAIYGENCSPPQIAAGGGALECVLVDCVLVGNRAVVEIDDTEPTPFVGGYGGGAAFSSALDCVFLENSVVKQPNAVPVGCGGTPPVELKGAGLYNFDPFSSGGSGADAIDCTFLRNSIGPVLPGESSMGGGAIGGKIWLSIFSENEALEWPAAQATLIEQCTIVNHQSAAGTASVDAATIDSSILWNNQPTSALPGATVRYSVVEGGYPGTNNTSANPLFWNVEALDVFLKPGSPAIDSGNPILPLDPDGSAPERGAIPFDPAHCGVPTTYCTAKLNSQGCLPAIGFTGTPSLTGADDCFVTASDVVNQKPGILIWGLGPQSQPFQSGTLCVASPNRTGPQNSGGNGGPEDCSGAYSFHMSQAFFATELLGWGDRVYAQYWYRDPNEPSGFGSGLSDGLFLTVCP